MEKSPENASLKKPANETWVCSCPALLSKHGGMTVNKSPMSLPGNVAQRKTFLPALAKVFQQPQIRGPLVSALQSLAAILIAVLAGALLLLLIGADPIAAYSALLKGA